MTVGAAEAWAALARLGRPLYGTGPRAAALAGPGWFALLTREPSCELNQCCLLPPATVPAAAALVRALGDGALPAILAVPADAEPAVLALVERAGFVRGSATEPIMWRTRPPAPLPSPFRVARARTEAEFAAVVEAAAEAHGVERGMVERTLGRAARAGEAEAWVAWDGAEAASVVAVTADAAAIAVWSMMTPPRHRRRGAGRAVLEGALAASWRATTAGAVLWATPSGRHLYAACGFAVLDEALGYARGADPAQLAALGQAGT